MGGLLSQRLLTVHTDDLHALPPLVGIINIAAGVIRLGGKVGAEGLEPAASRM